MDKLSELSKPMMYSITCNGVVEEIGGDSQGFVREEVQAELDSWENGSVGIPDGYSVSALYSQEFVAALKHKAAVNWEAAASLNVENQELKKRIAELEAKTAMTMGVGSGNGNLFVHGDYDSIKAAQAIVLENESLRAKLATPVRLLGEMLLHDWEHSVERQATFQHRKIAWDARLAEDKKAILAAGFTFTVEGDE